MRKKSSATPLYRKLGYDSGLEMALHYGKDAPLKAWDFHPKDAIAYSEPSVYQIDFRKKIGGVTYLVETKGRFRTRAESKKYLWIRKALQPHTELIFVFMEVPSTPDRTAYMPSAKARKDGTKQTLGDWATKNGFQWYRHTALPKRFTK